MSLPLYPTMPGLAYNVKWSPVFFNQSQKSITGASVDIGLAQYPLHNFELTYEFLRDTPGIYTAPGNEFKFLFAFYASIGGSLGRFAFNNPDDNLVTNQTIAVGDGVTSTFTMSRTLYGPISRAALEPVGIITGTPNVYVNGTLQVVGFDYNFFPSNGNNTIVFFGTPSVGAIISVDMAYYYYCKFADDSTTFEKFLNGRWMNQTVKIQSCRPGT